MNVEQNASANIFLGIDYVAMECIVGTHGHRIVLGGFINWTIRVKFCPVKVFWEI